MPTLRTNLRWLAAAVAVLLAAAALWWALQGDDGSDEPAADRSRSSTPSGSTDGPPASGSAPSGPPTTAAGTDRASGTPPAGGPSTTASGKPGGKTPSEPGGRNGQWGRGEGAATGGPSAACLGPGVTGTGAAAPVPSDAPVSRIRHQVAASLQLLRELSTPKALQPAVDGLRSYYRRVGELVGSDGNDVPAGTADQGRIEQLTEDVYARFGPDVVDFLNRRC